jgi:hypothetical protein
VNNKTTRQQTGSGPDLTASTAPFAFGFQKLGWLFVCLFAPALLAAPVQTNATKAAEAPRTMPSKPNRYLLVVETSKAVQRRSEGIYRAVHALLATGMGGQANPGDTIGLWTFNDDLYVGGFPLQEWSPRNQRGIIGKVMNYLTEQKFEKTTRFEKVLVALERVVHDSEYITVILVTDGSQKLGGTPFDNQINEAYKSWRAEQQEARMPFITVLRGKRGKLTDYTVNPAQWPLDMPPLPPELIPVVVKPPPVVAAAPPPVGPSLYLYGKKRSDTPILDPQTKVEISAPGTSAPAATPGKPAATQTESVVAPVAEPPRLDPEPREISRPGPVETKLLPPPAATSAPVSPATLVVAASPPPVPAAQTDSTAKAPEPVAAPRIAVAPVAPQAPERVADAKSPAALAAALPAQPVLNSGVMLIAGSVLVLLVLVGGALLMKAMKRARAVSHASLITRSLDRTGKE